MVKVSSDGEELSRRSNTQQDGQVYENELWSEMGPYGSIGAHIKTVRSHMAQDHVPTPLDPKQCYRAPKQLQTYCKSVRLM